MKTVSAAVFLTLAAIGTSWATEQSAPQTQPEAKQAMVPHSHMTEKTGMAAPKKSDEGTKPSAATLQKRHIHSRDAK